MMRWLKAVAASALVFGLAACEAGAPGAAGLFPIAGNQAQARGIRTLSVLDGSFRVRAPEGYCIDRRASRARSGFVVAAGCALVSSAGIMPDISGLITVQVGPSGSAVVAGSEQDMADFLGSEAGRALLSRTGRAADVTVERVQSTPNLIEVRFSDTSDDPIDGLHPTQSRAFLDINGHLVTVSVRSYARDPLGRRSAGRLLLMAVAALKATNPTEAPG